MFAIAAKRIAVSGATKTIIPKAFAASGMQANPFFLNKNFLSSGTSLADKEVNDLFTLWNDALATLDPDAVAKRYAKETILLPTVSDTPRKDYDTIKAYFVDFLKKEPQGVLLDSKVIKGKWMEDA